MSFKEIIGQDGGVALLKQAYLSGRIAHAYMFVGPQGVGKKKTALAFAQLLVCGQPLEGAEPCGACPSCSKALSLNHPDIIWVERDGQFVKIDAVREACRRLSLKSFEGTRKILVVPEAECLNDESSNALLKTLEEPSRDTVMILIAPTLKDVLPTISSRCQRIVYSSLAEGTLQGILSDSFGVGRQEAGYLSRMAGGSLGLALSYYENRLFSRKNRLIDAILDPGQRLDDCVDLSKQERGERDNKIREMLAVISSWLRDLWAAKASQDIDNLINSDRSQDVVQSGARLSFAELENRLSAVAQAYQDIERNVNARFALVNLRVILWNR